MSKFVCPRFARHNVLPVKLKIFAIPHPLPMSALVILGFIHLCATRACASEKLLSSPEVLDGESVSRRVWILITIITIVVFTFLI